MGVQGANCAPYFSIIPQRSFRTQRVKTTIKKNSLVKNSLTIIKSGSRGKILLKI